MKPAITTGRVFERFTLRMTANRNSFHAPTKARIAEAMMPGVVTGKTMRKKR